MNTEKNLKTLIVKKPLKLDCGKTINNFPIAYETYGTLNEKKDNAILVFHALTGDQFVTGLNPITNKDGWWSYAVGPGKAIDTNKYFVICSNVIGGCMGSYGPSDIDLSTNKILGTNFPVITINDMVNAQYNLLDFFKIDQLFCVAGGSMGGMQVLQFVSNFPDKAKIAIPIACTSSHSAQNIAFNEVARNAILSDPDFHGGNYYEHGVVPKRGLRLARMVGHITYLSDDDMAEKFGRTQREPAAGGAFHYGYGVEFEVESYLRYQGEKFSRYFDANTYLLITRALDYFDPARATNGDLAKALAPATAWRVSMKRRCRKLRGRSGCVTSLVLFCWMWLGFRQSGARLCWNPCALRCARMRWRGWWG